MVLNADAKERLDRFLARSLPQHSRTKLARLVEDGAVTVNGRLERPSFQLEAGMRIELDEPPPAEAHDLEPADIHLDVVYEDEELLVVNKPRGLAAHPAASLKEPSLVNALLARSTPLSGAAGSFRPGIVHRLDKDTTGLMVVAKNDSAHVKLARQLELKSAGRRYFAVVAGAVEREHFSIDAPLARSKTNRMLMTVDLHGRKAITHVKLLGKAEYGSTLGVRLETGRTHQIRAHLAAFAMPVLGDRLYAPRSLATGPLQLHAAYLSFEHPTSGEGVSFYAPPPSDFLGAERLSARQLEPF